MRPSTRVFVLSTLPVWGLAGTAKAEDAEPIDFSLQYRAAEGCPNAASFESALRARLPGARRLATSESSERIPSLRVELRAADGPKSSEIAGNLPDGTGFRREVTGAACADLMQSMAVIAAMALENNRRRATSASPTAPVSAPPQEEVATTRPVPTTAAAAPSVELAVHHVAASSNEEVWRPSWQWSALATAGIAGGVAPDVAPTFALGLELADSRPRGVSPSVRLSGLFAQSLTKHVDSADVQFRLLAARLDLCPAHARGSALAATGCVELDLGQLRGSADGVTHARAQSMLWLGIGLVGRAQVALSSRLAVELGAGARALPVHDRFILSPSRRVFEVPVIAWDMLAGLAYSWR